MKNDLIHKKCTPCRSGQKPLRGVEIQNYMSKLSGGWNVVDEQYLEKKYAFPNFKSAFHFAETVARIAEQENHHPTITISWGLVRLKIYTHKIQGLSENDFIIASKCDQKFLSNSKKQKDSDVR